MERFVVRPATLDDASAIGRVQVLSWRDTYPELDAAFWERFTIGQATENWRTWMHDGAAPWVGEVANEVVGFALARRARESAGYPPVRGTEVYALYVLTPHHGSGVGQALLDAVLASEAPAQLWVAQHNPRAIAFYRRNGFEPDGATDDGAQFHAIPALRMVR